MLKVGDSMCNRIKYRHRYGKLCGYAKLLKIRGKFDTDFMGIFDIKSGSPLFVSRYLQLRNVFLNPVISWAR